MPRRSTRTKKKPEGSPPATPKRTRKAAKKEEDVDVEVVGEEKEEKKEEMQEEKKEEMEEEKKEEKEEEVEKPEAEAPMEEKVPETAKARTGGEEEPQTRVTEKEGEKEVETKVLEKGRIYFLYRPKVGVEEAEDWEDVQRLYMVLWPGAPGIEKEAEKAEEKVGAEVEESKAEMKGIERIIVIARKKLPSPHDHGRYWAFVDKVGSRKSVQKVLEEATYETKTRGQRHLEGARPVGEGVYGIVEKGRNTYLAYVLELPQDITEVQQSFNIEKEASMIISVKNPEIPTPHGFPRMHGDRKVQFPEHLTKKFEETKKATHPYKFFPANPPEFLDHEGCELLLIGAKEDIVKELGKSAELLEEIENMELKELKDEKLFQELHLDMKQHPVEPLHGEWK